MYGGGTVDIVIELDDKLTVQCRLYHKALGKRMKYIRNEQVFSFYNLQICAK